MSYLIKPTNVITGAKAPGIISYCEKTDDAIYDAMKRSRLSLYERWSFSSDVTRLKDKLSEKEKRRQYEKD